MSRIERLNGLPEAEKFKVYSLLVPSSLLRRFGIDPETGRNEAGDLCVTVESPPGKVEGSLKVELKRDDRDPLFYIEVSDSRDLVKMRWDFILINDPDSLRFETDRTPEGGDRWLNWRRRNHKEEKRALAHGLAPGQARKGLRLTRELQQSLDDFAEALGFKSIALEALFYHNAVVYERHGYRYFQDEKAMRQIHEGFAPGGPLFRRLEGSTFRQPWFAGSVRGRSWAIHSGIVDEVWEQGFDPWTPPLMYRMVGGSFEVDTAPGLPY